ncbi:MAG TPA: proteasome subunit alpha [Acidimicrobiaceae bacterium]|nr:proteasome subunit alpha [Acidimicrobiaceae bacterium]HCB37935.1 proteasome subunit alpha [Acidimicrobiaceae bacterium]
MSMPGMYVTPEQLMADRADFARKGISRGRSLVVLEYDEGIAMVAQNASSTLRKISEIYDRIAFGGVGRYSEFDTLRIAGVRQAELTGFQYSRHDVEARSLANGYAQMLGHTFTHEMKPLEVELVVAELAEPGGRNSIYRIQYDGTVTDQQLFCCIGGESDAVLERVEEGYRDALSRDEAIVLAVAALAGPDDELTADELEVAVLRPSAGDEVLARHCFHRLADDEVAAVVAAAPRSDSSADDDDDTDEASA